MLEGRQYCLAISQNFYTRSRVLRFEAIFLLARVFRN